jgi:hypothetical protein
MSLPNLFLPPLKALLDLDAMLLGPGSHPSEVLREVAQFLLSRYLPP